jgi:hypothetical protein
MMGLLMHFIDAAGAAVERGVSVDDIAALPLLRQLRRLGEEVAEDDLEATTRLRARVGEAFHELASGDHGER